MRPLHGGAKFLNIMTPEPVRGVALMRAHNHLTKSGFRWLGSEEMPEYTLLSVQFGHSSEPETFESTDAAGDPTRVAPFKDAYGSVCNFAENNIRAELSSEDCSDRLYAAEGDL